jgi:hypothetical protein
MVTPAAEEVTARPAGRWSVASAGPAVTPSGHFPDTRVRPPAAHAPIARLGPTAPLLPCATAQRGKLRQRRRPIAAGAGRRSAPDLALRFLWESQL